jgi:hypothetical protein
MDSSNSDEVQLSTGRSASATPLADALLHDDPRPGYASPGIAMLDDEGTLTLTRALPRVVLCLKVSYVEKVDQVLNIPSRAVSNLRAWLNRQILASQGINEMPKSNTRAMTTLDQIWEILAQFEADKKNKSVIIRATPLDVGFKTPIVEASVFPTTASSIATGPNQQSDMDAPTCLTKGHNNFLDRENQQECTLASVASGYDIPPRAADIASQFEVQALQAEITRLKQSVNDYAGRVQRANNSIRKLRNELRDSNDITKELRDKCIRTEKKLDIFVGSGAVNKVSHFNVILHRHLIILSSKAPLAHASSCRVCSVLFSQTCSQLLYAC